MAAVECDQASEHSEVLEVGLAAACAEHAGEVADRRDGWAHALAERLAAGRAAYRSTPVGLEVAHFIRWFRSEYGATDETLRDYEAILGKLAIDHADLELAAFEPPDGTTRLREFIDARWGDAAPRTRKKVRAVLMSFFKWAQAEFKLQGNPGGPHPLASTPGRRARAVLRGGRRPYRRRATGAALRKGELAAIRYRDFDLGRRGLRVNGNGGKIRHTPIPTEELRQEIGELSLRRDPTEHLLYPPEARAEGHDHLGDRRKPLSGPALHRWWYRCLARAGVVDEGTTHGKKMHGARYTSGTEFYLATGDIYATQQLRQGYAEVTRRNHSRPPTGKVAHLWWYRALERAGLVEKGQTAGVNMHRGRHTSATELQRSTHDLRLTQNLLGHVDIRSTARYAQLDNDDLAQALTRLFEANE